MSPTSNTPTPATRLSPAAGWELEEAIVADDITVDTSAATAAPTATVVLIETVVGWEADDRNATAAPSPKKRF
eukprot:CAMPEP_0185763986 /NCGR_PEP_ID=MMETSP1174-20130828/22882_1 /TAXON_ID=35687 /ORGANISM="Dictyocha speculum, Strain CCMP1381" /LENGTH=72 /DNA_ID=CAMNT_0028446319 /DNA_START=20 /DNA_END=238 /DNA_ORIENTATION=-